MQYFLVEEVKVTEENLNLSYYRIEQKKTDASTSYGVRVDMTGASSATMSILGVFTQRELIDKFLHTIAKASVTPTTLREITEEYVCDMLYVV